MIDGPPLLAKVDDDEHVGFEWSGWFSRAFAVLAKDKGYGVTGDRPVNGISVSDYYFDTTLGYIIHYDGTNWVDATGSTV